MKTQTSLPLQPKWLCAAAIGAITLGAIVGANAQNAPAATDIPAPPRVAARPLPDEMDGPPEGEDGPPEFDERGPGPRPDGNGPRRGGPCGRGGQEGDRRGGPRGPQGPGEGPEDMGPPRDEMGGMGPRGFGPGGRGMGGPGRGGPGPDGRRPGPGRGADMNTADGAARAIEHAFRVGGEADSGGKLKGDALNLQGQAHDYYNRAMDAYKAKNYNKASILADVSSHLSHAATALNDNDTPRGAAGWATPPALAKPTAGKTADNMDQDRVAMALDRSYRELSNPMQGKDATAQRWFATAKTFYKTASTSYNAKKYDVAEINAVAADEISKAAHSLSDVEQL